MFDYTNYINDYLEESLSVAKKQRNLTNEILDISKEFINCIENSGKIIVLEMEDLHLIVYIL